MRAVIPRREFRADARRRRRPRPNGFAKRGAVRGVPRRVPTAPRETTETPRNASARGRRSNARATCLASRRERVNLLPRFVVDVFEFYIRAFRVRDSSSPAIRGRVRVFGRFLFPRHLRRRLGRSCAGSIPARDGGETVAVPRRRGDSDGARVAIVHAESARSRVERRAFVQRNGRAGFPRGRRTKPSCLFGGGRRRSRRSVSIPGSYDASTVEVVFDGGGGRSRPQASRVVASARTGGWFAKGSYGGGCVWPSRLRAVVSNGVDAAAVQIVAWSTLGGGVWSRARRARDGRRERAEGAILAGEALDGGGARGGSRRGVLRGGSRGARRAVVDVSTVIARPRMARARSRGDARARRWA